MQAKVIVNASGGKIAARPEEYSEERLAALFAQHGLSPSIQYVTGSELENAVAVAMTERPGAVIIGGGDGTIGTAVGHVIGTHTVLGTLPMGTLNHFCKDAGIGNDVAEAVATIAAGNVRAVDAASVNGRFFVNNCSVGAYPAAVRRREHLRTLHGYRKWPAMTRAMFEVLRDMRRLRVAIEADGTVRRRKTPFVLISNNRYAGHLFSPSLREHLDAGQLWVYSTRIDHYLPALRLAGLALIGKLDEADEFECWTTRELSLNVPAPKISVAVDGELTSMTVPLRASIHPGALRVFAPNKPT